MRLSFTGRDTVVELTRGDLFASTADAILNPVNCEGVMGAGLALEFKRRYPDNFRAYADFCKLGSLEPGVLLPVPLSIVTPPYYIVNFPTKDCWRNPSKYEYIEQGLVTLEAWCWHEGIETVAMPALGAGLGGLDWHQVYNRVIDVFGGDRYTTIYFYKPQ